MFLITPENTTERILAASLTSVVESFKWIHLHSLETLNLYLCSFPVWLSTYSRLTHDENGSLQASMGCGS